METLLKVMSLLSSGLFAGAAFYVTAVEHPARMSLGASIALQEFRPSYKRAAPLQAALAVICFLNSLVVWRLTGRWAWLAGGALVGAVVPFTLAFVMPTNRLLLDAASPPKDEGASRLLAKWARLHAVRTCLSLLGFVVLLVLDHRGLVWNCPTGALAHLGLARAYAMQGDTAKARAAYNDFLTLWKDADPDIPILQQAKAEYAKLR